MANSGRGKKQGLQAIAEPITELIRLVQQGDEAARVKLWNIVFPFLKQRAEAMLKADRAAGVIRPSDLLQDAFVQLIAHEKIGWNDRKHLYAFAVEVMRHLVTDQARRRFGKGRIFTPVDDSLGIAITDDKLNWVEVDEILKQLADEHGAVKAQVVGLRAYAGLTNDEIAEQLDISPATVKRHIKVARAFIMSRMKK